MIADRIFDGFRDRMKNISVFKPIIELQQKRKYEYPIMEIGIAVMLYILETMLIGDKNCTYKKIAYFLQDLISTHFEDDISYNKALDISHYIVREILMNEGKPHNIEYYNFEHEEDDEYNFHLIELQDYDIDDKIVKFKLSTTGLELLFKTKEMYNELQVSISQLYLRQQIQKGVFDGALRSIEELELAVKNEKNKLRKLRERIIRDVLGVAKEGEYEKHLERINDQLNRERKLFYELKDLVQKTLEEYYEEGLENEDLNKVLKLKNRLIDVMSLHETLFSDKLNLEDLMNKTIESMILNVFDTRLNFETEVVENIIKNNSSIDQIRKTIEPVFSPKINSIFNPMRIFEKQKLHKSKDIPEDKLWELHQEKIREQEKREREMQKERKEKIKKYLKLLLNPLRKKESIRLSKVLKDLKNENKKRYEKLLNDVDFYSFILKLHQLENIPVETDTKQGYIIDQLYWSIVDIANKDKEIAKIDAFELIAEDEIIKFKPGYVLSDYTIRRI